MKRFFGMALTMALGVMLSQSAHAQWTINTYKGAPTIGQINNYASADALIGGANMAPGFPVAADYTLANTQDNGDGGGPFGLGTQVVGLPAGDNDDFAFVGKGQFQVNVSGKYVFVTNTDDGSRLRGSVGGGPVSQVITDDVLSGAHDAPSDGIDLPAGAIVDFDWMWFERGGGAEGELYYRVDTGAGFGPNALIGDSSQGLALIGGKFTGTVYKSVVTAGQVINNFADAQNVINTPGTLKGTEQRDVFNIVGGGGDADFAGGQSAPGLTGDVDDYIAVGSGYIHVGAGQAGGYQFRSNTDDGGRLKIDLNQNGQFDAGEAVIDHDVLQGPTNTNSAIVNLAEGYYMVEYSFFERGGGDEGEVSARLGNSGAFILLGNNASGGLDVVSQVPEPTSLVLAGLGVLGSFSAARRRRA